MKNILIVALFLSSSIASIATANVDPEAAMCRVHEPRSCAVPDQGNGMPGSQLRRSRRILSLPSPLPLLRSRSAGCNLRSVSGPGRGESAKRRAPRRHQRKQTPDAHRPPDRRYRTNNSVFISYAGASIYINRVVFRARSRVATRCYRGMGQLYFRVC